MAVDLALARTERRGIGIMDQQKLQLVDVHPTDGILERLAISFIAERVVIAFDENVPPVQLRTNGRKVDKTISGIIPMAEIAHVQHEALQRVARPLLQRRIRRPHGLFVSVEIKLAVSKGS